MIPRLGSKYDIKIETVPRPRAEYTTSEYLRSGLPKAPAIMVGDEVVVEGFDISENKLEVIICRHLGLAELPKKKKSFFDRITGR